MTKLYPPLDDTIAAIATAPMDGAIAIIRISGKKACAIGAACFSKDKFTSHTVHYGKILDSSGKILDTVLLIPLLAPRSYTGEDTIEIHCHGGLLVTKKVIERIFELGARPAEPGEFTMRAFLNGKMDLTQAESVQAVIKAKNNASLDAASAQLEGVLSRKVKNFQKRLLTLAAEVEARVDFPEEDLGFASYTDLIHSLETLVNEISLLIKTFVTGKKLNTALSLCLAGVPNAGKSSLMNLLIGSERAIVTPIAGTTRDTIEEEVTLAGLHLFLIDTAGIRATSDEVEQEGIRRSKQAIAKADLTLLVLDPGKIACSEQNALLQEHSGAKTLYLWNKIDLSPTFQIPTPPGQSLAISAKHEVGLSALLEKLQQFAYSSPQHAKEEIILTNQRHEQALTEALQHLQTAIHNLQTGASAEFVAIDLKDALYALSSLLGLNVEEEILSSIFSQFCLGK